jgi:hypothetical protein
MPMPMGGLVHKNTAGNFLLRNATCVFAGCFLIAFVSCGFLSPSPRNRCHKGYLLGARSGISLSNFSGSFAPPLFTLTPNSQP